MEAGGIRQAGGATGQRRVLQAAVAIATLGLALIWADPAHGSTPPLPWQPAVRSLRGATTWVPEGERQSRHIGNAHPAVLFVGDSITQWWQRFGLATWNQDFAPLHAADDGVAGDTTSNVLARLDDGSLVGVHPRVAVVMIGTNNIPLHQSAPDIVRGILAVVTDLDHRLPDTELILLGVLPRDTPSSRYRQTVMAIDHLLARDTVQAGLTYLDLGPLLLHSDGSFQAGVMNSDQLHPAAAGYARLGAALLPVVTHLLTAPS